VTINDIHRVKGMNRTARLALVAPIAAACVLAAGCSGGSSKPSAQASASASASAKGAVLPGEVTAKMSASQAAKLAAEVRKFPGVSTTLYEAKARVLHVYFSPGVTDAQKLHAAVAIGAKPS